MVGNCGLLLSLWAVEFKWRGWDMETDNMRMSRGYKTDLVVCDQQAFTAVHIGRMGLTQDFPQTPISLCYQLL